MKGTMGNRKGYFGKQIAIVINTKKRQKGGSENYKQRYET
jgi:hypothetical protein